MNRMDRKFAKSLKLHDIGPEWSAVMFNYVVLGLDPGSFINALLANDFIEMAMTSHPSNRWEIIQNLGKWLYWHAPKQCHGSKENIKQWMAMSNDERRAICEELNILTSAWEILKEYQPIP